MKFLQKKAFTTADVILIMIILGIIAMIMITTIKPADFKQKALKVTSRKVFSEIDYAMTQIKLNHTKANRLDKMCIDEEEGYFSFGDDLRKTEQLFRKYLTVMNETYNNSNKLGQLSEIINDSPTALSQSPPFYLKNGALIFLGAGEKFGVSKNASDNFTIAECTMPKAQLGIIAIDINGAEQPNEAFKDQFYFPIGVNGINYEKMCINTEAP